MSSGSILAPCALCGRRNGSASPHVIEFPVALCPGPTVSVVYPDRRYPAVGHASIDAWLCSRCRADAETLVGTIGAAIRRLNEYPIGNGPVELELELRIAKALILIGHEAPRGSDEWDLCRAFMYPDLASDLQERSLDQYRTAFAFQEHPKCVDGPSDRAAWIGVLKRLEAWAVAEGVEWKFRV